MIRRFLVIKRTFLGKGNGSGFRRVGLMKDDEIEHNGECFSTIFRKKELFKNPKISKNAIEKALKRGVIKEI